jgi:hypothetical protein
MLLDTDPDSQYGSRPEPGQCFGPEFDPHSMRSEDPNPDLESRYGSGKAKWPTKNMWRNFLVWSSECSPWVAGGFSYRWLKALHGALGIKILHFKSKRWNVFQLWNFWIFGHQNLDVDPDSPKSLDPIPDSVNSDLKNWLPVWIRIEKRIPGP